MKKILSYLIPAFVIASLFVSCAEDDISFDEELLIGKWQDGSLFYRYDSDGTGATWDEADDIDEDEAQPFTWTLIKAELTQIHLMEMGGTVPKVYEVTELTATRLRYKDDFGNHFSFTKVTEE